MSKSWFLFFVLWFWSIFSRAQEPEKDVVIQQAKEEYRFIKGDAENPVKVKQSQETVYFCKDYVSSILVTEFYNNQVEVNNVEVYVNGNKDKKFTAQYDYYNPDGIFYSDAKVCYFKLPFAKKDSPSKVQLEKTVLDPRYFTSIFFTEPYFVERKEISIIVPYWMKIEIKEFNFEGYNISKQVLNRDGDNVYSFVIENVKPIKNERHAPGYTYLAPHLLIMCKYAEPAGQRITYFSTLADQYNWYRHLVKQIGNDGALIKTKAEEITKGLSDETEKVKVIFQWVQDNIRYIAYEDGIAGFKPEKAQEVLKKKYGDCKGMSNLLAEMLKAIGLDGRLCWLGTNHIAYDYSTPSLCVDNHMICAWLYKGKTYFLDATEKYIGFDEIAERIQGRQVLIEDGDKYILQRIPVMTEMQNTAFEKRVLTINGSNLEGKVTQVWKGESKEWLLSQINTIKKEKQDEVLKRFLAGERSNYQISNLKIINLDNYNADLKVEYDLIFKNAVTTFGKESYIDVDDRRDYAAVQFDTAKRKLPYLFPYKDKVVFEVELQLPKDMKPGQLPEGLRLEEAGYSMQASYSSNESKIIYKREIILKNTWLKNQDFIKWNTDIERLNVFYNNQLVLTK